LAPVPEMGYGFGLGFAVRTAAGRCPLPGSVGEYFWGGVFGTAFWIDPVEELIAVAMMLAPERRLYYRPLLRPLVYGAVTGPVARGPAASGSFPLSGLVQARADIEGCRAAQIARMGIVVRAAAM